MIPARLLLLGHLGAISLRPTEVQLREPPFHRKCISPWRRRKRHVLCDALRGRTRGKSGTFIVQTQCAGQLRPFRMAGNQNLQTRKCVVRIVDQPVIRVPPPTGTAFRSVSHRQRNISGITRVDLNTGQSFLNSFHDRRGQICMGLANEHMAVLTDHRRQTLRNHVPFLTATSPGGFKGRKPRLIESTSLGNRSAKLKRQCRSRFWDTETDINSGQRHLKQQIGPEVHDRPYSMRLEATSPNH